MASYMKKLKTWRRKSFKNPTVNYWQGRGPFSQLFSFLFFRYSVTPVHPLPLLHMHPVFPPETGPPLHALCLCICSWLPLLQLSLLFQDYIFFSLKCFQPSAPQDDVGVPPLVPRNLIPMYLFIIALLIIHWNHGGFFWLVSPTLGNSQGKRWFCSL